MNFSEKGPRPRFGERDLWRALEFIEKEGELGRKRLSDKLGLGEGSTRTILEQLKNRGLIKSTSTGHSLTKKGKKELDRKSEKCLFLDAGDLTVGERDAAVLVRAAATSVRWGIEQRDEAIKVGAEGATILVYKDGSLGTPGLDMEVDETVEKELLDYVHPEEGDVIVIGTSEEKSMAKMGALAAAEALESESSTKRPSRS